MIVKYGQDVGREKWAVYCDRQAFSNTFEYKREKYGWDIEKFNTYNKSRSVTLDNLIRKHGKGIGKEKFAAYRDKQAKNGNKVEYFIEKLGEQEGVNKYIEICKHKSMNITGFILRHGVATGIEKYYQYVENKKLNSGFYSKSSQELFWDIYNSLDYNIKQHCNFAELNKEKPIIYKENDVYKFSFIDFTINSPLIRLAIEFNGEHVHPRKDVMNEVEWNTWKDPWMGYSAAEKYEIDVKKEAQIKRRYKYFYIVWHKEYVNNKIITTQKIINNIKTTLDTDFGK
jgi:hypothetical protein